MKNYIIRLSVEDGRLPGLPYLNTPVPEGQEPSLEDIRELLERQTRIVSGLDIKIITIKEINEQRR